MLETESNAFPKSVDLLKCCL